MAGEHRIEVVLFDDAIEQLDELRGGAPPLPYGPARRFTSPAEVALLLPRESRSALALSRSHRPAPKHVQIGHRLRPPVSRWPQEMCILRLSRSSHG